MSLLYLSADHALERYLRLRSSLAQVRGQDLSLGSGWADHCHRSRCRTLTTTRIEREDGSSYCDRCGDPWPFRPAATATRIGEHREPHGAVHEWRKRDLERGREVRPTGSRHPTAGIGAAQQLHGRLAELSLLGVILTEPPGLRRGDPAAIWRTSAASWERRLRIWCCYLSPSQEQRESATTMSLRGWTYEHVASVLRPDIRRLGEQPSPRAVAAIIRDAREAVEARLAGRSLLAPSGSTKG